MVMGKLVAGILSAALEQEDGLGSKVEVDKVLGFMSYIRSCGRVSEGGGIVRRPHDQGPEPRCPHTSSQLAPCYVQNLPKFRPTMQCQVGPYLLSKSFLM